MLVIVRESAENPLKSGARITVIWPDIWNMLVRFRL